MGSGDGGGGHVECVMFSTFLCEFAAQLGLTGYRMFSNWYNSCQSSLNHVTMLSSELLVYITVETLATNYSAVIFDLSPVVHILAILDSLPPFCHRNSNVGLLTTARRDGLLLCSVIGVGRRNLFGPLNYLLRFSASISPSI